MFNRLVLGDANQRQQQERSPSETAPQRPIMSLMFGSTLIFPWETSNCPFPGPLPSSRRHFRVRALIRVSHLASIHWDRCGSQAPISVDARRAIGVDLALGERPLAHDVGRVHRQHRRHQIHVDSSAIALPSTCRSHRLASPCESIPTAPPCSALSVLQVGLKQSCRLVPFVPLGSIGKSLFGNTSAHLA